MDQESKNKLLEMLKTQRLAAIGTLRNGWPLVSQILFVMAPGYHSIYTRLSRLAQHTQDITQDGRVGLLIAQTDHGTGDPQLLARISIKGEIQALGSDDPEYDIAREIYIERYPEAGVTFDLGDFAMYRIVIKSARYVAGFGKTFNLTAHDFPLLTKEGSPRS
jgi:hypothetical protein